ncbi:MAG: polysaccharide biosynthesis protein [Pusillimonas sp.]|nr:polysaccharide biosynthesis protein [Pusillimonas sp.]MBC43458.1 polysaccharide biosynthesis protein [Pusillimonas sp.]
MLTRLAQPILAMPRFAKRLVVLAVDICLCVLTVWLAFYLRLDIWVRVWGGSFFQPEWAIAASIIIALPIFITHGFYRVIFRYSDLSAIGTVLKAFGLYALIYIVVITVIGLPGVPRSIGIIQPMLLLFAVGLSRAFARLWLGGMYQAHWQRLTLPKALIYGAGASGRQLAAAIHNSTEMRIAGYLDDDLRLHGQVLNGLPVYNPASLPALVENKNIRTVLLAMPSLPRRRRNEIISNIRHAKVAVRTLPNMTELAQGKTNLTDLHDLDIDDLLGREPVPPDPTLLAKNITGKTVLVTGAGGSIGSELCRQIMQLEPAKLLLVDQSEYSLYTIHEELIKKTITQNTLIPLLASVQDKDRLHSIISTWKPNTIYHAAAYKHVPIVEHNPIEGIKNNVMGTLNIAMLATEFGIQDFVLISTDKAVRPTNIMGATKRLAEMVLQALAERETKTRFSIVRFGNVLGSSGSVVPLFRQQISSGGPVTVTHSEVTRYFMTIPEAAQLVIQAGAMAQGKGGEVFVLDMGQPVKIIKLAERLIELSGYSVRSNHNPNGEISIEIIGLRPGEKLYEELLIGDNPKSTSHSRIMKAIETFVIWDELSHELDKLNLALNSNHVSATLIALKRLVPNYLPHNCIVDWVAMHQATLPENTT